MKLCDECGINPANIHLTQIVNSETHVYHLCDECASDKGISITLDNDEDMVMAEQKSNSSPVEKKMEEEKVCQGCNLKLSDFRAKGWLGCSTCYGSFEKEINELLVQVHGSSLHRGKKYAGSTTQGKRVHDLEHLRSQLDLAIRNEEFEQAAAIRDAIHSIKQMGVK
ncbi:UvrB/UvrC motif-containing protein [Chitinispirillales bacterium ANBcel5]|uniref:UvrB/UvrC motif-containing protein n=1 Tax=Cellulosispirillum alkaliphilum TaxID=3039283 RepID=UPI002A56A353|nr:UvrB/UvrC motif-containing protein [Chitinispirillales bacterium ANBcel5]